jgi:hypothetical protein
MFVYYHDKHHHHRHLARVTIGKHRNRIDLGESQMRLSVSTGSQAINTSSIFVSRVPSVIYFAQRRPPWLRACLGCQIAIRDWTLQEKVGLRALHRD